MPERIYLNRRPGDERIHIEIPDNEIADLLDDLAENPDWFEATKSLRSVLVQAAADLYLTYG